MPNLKLTYAHSLALATTAVGFLVSFIPAFAPQKQHLIIGAAVLLSLAIVLSDAIKNAGKGESLTTVSVDAVENALKQVDLSSLVQTELAKIAVGSSRPPVVYPNRVPPPPTPPQAPPQA